MPLSEQQALQLARAQTRDVLGDSPTYAELPLHEKKAMYTDMVRKISRDLAAKDGIGRRRAQSLAERADDLIDDQRHLNKRIEQAGDLAADYVNQLQFPKFVGDLLKGVFDANITVMHAQTEDFLKLLKASTASLAKFVNQIDNTSAFGYLADNQSDEFSFDFDDDEKSDENPEGAVLTDKEGNKLDIGDNELKAKIMDAKIAMAREQRALLREVMLMGVTRLVVQKGNVKAGVVFDFRAGEKIQKGDKAATKKASSSGGSIRGSGGFIGSIIGGPSGGQSWSNSESQITVASAKSMADSSLSAKLTGSVDITFATDYFKLDNFAQMYAQQPVAGAPGAVPAAPPAPAAPVPAAR